MGTAARQHSARARCFSRPAPRPGTLERRRSVERHLARGGRADGRPASDGRGLGPRVDEERIGPGRSAPARPAGTPHLDVRVAPSVGVGPAGDRGRTPETSQPTRPQGSGPRDSGDEGSLPDATGPGAGHGWAPPDGRTPDRGCLGARGARRSPRRGRVEPGEPAATRHLPVALGSCSIAALPSSTESAPFGRPTGEVVDRRARPDHDPARDHGRRGGDPQRRRRVTSTTSGCRSDPIPAATGRSRRRSGDRGHESGPELRGARKVPRRSGADPGRPPARPPDPSATSGPEARLTSGPEPGSRAGRGRGPAYGR
jgi:hypothetical protein